MAGGARAFFPSPCRAPGASASSCASTNVSAIPFRLRPRPSPAWLSLEAVTVQPRVTSLLSLRISRDAPAGRHQVALQVEVTNLHTAPGQELVVTLPLDITVGLSPDCS